MIGSWLYVLDRREWRLYDLGRLQLRVAAERVDALAREHGCSRERVLRWLGSRPTAPLTAA